MNHPCILHIMSHDSYRYIPSNYHHLALLCSSHLQGGLSWAARLQTSRPPCKHPEKASYAPETCSPFAPGNYSCTAAEEDTVPGTAAVPETAADSNPAALAPAHSQPGVRPARPKDKELHRQHHSVLAEVGPQEGRCCEDCGGGRRGTRRGRRDPRLQRLQLCLPQWRPRECCCSRRRSREQMLAKYSMTQSMRL